MSLIEKIDAEIVRLEKERDLFPRWINPEKHDEADAAVKEAYRIREIIISEQKEPCEYCTENPCWLCKSAGECQTWQHCAGNDRIDYSPVQNYCHVCGRPLNRPYTDSKIN